MRQDLLDSIKELHQKDNQLHDVNIEIPQISNSISVLWEMVMREYGIPEDNTVEISKKYGGDCNKIWDDPETFCTDFITDWIWEFSEGDMTKEDLIEHLTNWKKYGDILDKKAGLI